VRCFSDQWRYASGRLILRATPPLVCHEGAQPSHLFWSAADLALGVLAGQVIAQPCALSPAPVCVGDLDPSAPDCEARRPIARRIRTRYCLELCPRSAIHARLVEVKNVSPEVSERQALSNLIRRSRSRKPIMTHDSLSLMSRVDVGARLAGLEHRREVSLSPTVSCVPRRENFLMRLRSCAGMSKLLEWFLLLFATMASSQFQAARSWGRRLSRLAYASTRSEGRATYIASPNSLLFFYIVSC
jgi:hypothetical protein